ncbi:MAG TPA: beta-ketoacyl synthase N-terminal-like domain-containing protein [Anaerolineales bacterium]|nr:beta-ketoacyl synthase N-terminal-like domain-containing protein [Anaerolineales bacterium]
MNTDFLRGVSIVGIGQIPVMRQNPEPLKDMGARVARMAMEDAGVDRVDALFAGNMLADELQNQKQIAALIASECGLRGIEALHVRAATATGAAALRMAYFAVASGEARLAMAVGVEKMSGGLVTPVLAKALDARSETDAGHTLLSQNAALMQLYMDRHAVDVNAFNPFAVIAHHNARTNPYAIFKDKRVSDRTVRASRVIFPPLRLFDASPVCDGAAAVVLARTEEARAYSDNPVRLLGSSVATDWFRVADREDPLELFAAAKSAYDAFRKSNVNRNDVSLFEAHDAFSIMVCLQLEAAGFAEPGEGWRMAKEGRIKLKGDLPLTTFGGLKARGHPIGATALYQTCEIVLQLTDRAGRNQVRDARIAMLQSIGGVGSTVITHVFGV